MRSRIQQLLFSTIAVLLAGQSTAAEDLSRFHRQTLLERFDSNHNEQLDPRERRALRRAFGGIDIPMLPSRSFDYTTLHLPGHLDKAQLDEADNTPDDNPLTDQGATLGRVLFYDRQLSRNNTVACASCHHQRTGFAGDHRHGFHGGLDGNGNQLPSGPGIYLA